MNLDHKSIFKDDQIYKKIVMHKMLCKEDYDNKSVEYDGH